LIVIVILPVHSLPRHSGAHRRCEPGIHNPCLSDQAPPGLWIPDRRCAASGM